MELSLYWKRSHMASGVSYTGWLAVAGEPAGDSGVPRKPV